MVGRLRRAAVATRSSFFFIRVGFSFHERVCTDRRRDPGMLPLSRWNPAGVDGLRRKSSHKRSWSWFAGNQKLRGWRDAIRLGEVALVDSEGEAAARVDVEKGLADGDVAEGFVEGDGVAFAVEGDGNGIAELIAELREYRLGDIKDEIAVGTVGADDIAVEAFDVDGGGGDVEADELGDIEGGTGLGPVVAASEMCAGGREDVAAVEG